MKGKLTGIPVAVVRGLTPHDDGSNARTLLRPGEEDLFWLGTDEAHRAGPQPGPADAPIGPPVQRRTRRHPNSSRRPSPRR